MLASTDRFNAAGRYILTLSTAVVAVGLVLATAKQGLELNRRQPYIHGPEQHRKPGLESSSDSTRYGISAMGDVRDGEAVMTERPLLFSLRSFVVSPSRTRKQYKPLLYRVSQQLILALSVVAEAVRLVI
jgi:hypothetical protein